MHQARNEKSSVDTRQDWWHNIVKVTRIHKENQSSKYLKAIKQSLAENDERDLNKLDSLGRTALHAAVKNRNADAVIALLLCGADVNITDIHGNTPVTFIDNTQNIGILNDLKYHIRKLIAFRMYVSDLNMEWYCSACFQYDHSCVVGKYDVEFVELWRSRINQCISRTIEVCQDNLEKMKDIRINECTTLHCVFYNGAEELAFSPIKLCEIEKIIKADDFYENFGFYNGLGDLLVLMYRRACSRRKLLTAVEEALLTLFQFELPSLCLEFVIKNLSDFDLVNVINSVNFT